MNCFYRFKHWATTDRISSGPIKGYTEALEHRLEVTENALLRILSVIEPTVLQAAFHNRENPSNTDEELNASSAAKDVSLVRSSEDKSALMAHWDEYALDNADSILRWSSVVRNSRDKCSDDLDSIYDGGASKELDGADDSRARAVLRSAVGGESGMLSAGRRQIQQLPKPGRPESLAPIDPELAEPGNSQQIQAGSRSGQPLVSNHTHGQISNVSQDFRQQYLW